MSNYVLLVVVSVVSLMSGILSIGRDVLSLWRPEQSLSDKRRRFWLILRIAFFLSAAIVWYAERQRGNEIAATLNAQIAAINEQNALSDLKCNIDYFAAFEARDAVSGQTLSGQPETTIILIATIKNRGAPSMVDGYRLVFTLPTTFTLPNGQTSALQRTDRRALKMLEQRPTEQGFIAVPMHFDEEEKTLIDKDLHKVIINKADFLMEKTSKPIVKGGVENGLMLYALPGIKVNQLTEVRFALSLYDANDREYLVPIEIPLNSFNAQGPLPYVTGLKSRSVAPGP